MSEIVSSRQFSERPKVTVCIPVLNGAQTLGSQLQALSTQVSPYRYSIVVADNGSSDTTVDVALSWSGVLDVLVVDASRRRGINTARNEAARHARGDLLLFCDADDQVHSGWISAMARALEEYDAAGGVCREIRDGRVIREIQNELVLGYLPSPIGANCGVRRDVLEAIGGFDESYYAGSDERDFFIRLQEAGYSLGFAPDALVDYQRPLRRPAEEFRRGVLRGIQQAHLFSDHRKRGMRREKAGTTLRVWAYIVKSAIRYPTLVPLARTELAETTGRRVGRLLGSVRYCSLFA